MPRKYFRKFLPSHEAVKNNRHIARFGSFLHHPNLWHLNRDSVAGGVAIGLFSGLVPGPFQMLTAAILCVLFKVNLPVGLATTIYTNPLTIGPLYLIAYRIGRLLVGGHGVAAPPPDMDWSLPGTWMEALLTWMLSLGKPLAIGLVVLALALAVLGYLFVQLGWRAYVVLAWRRRAKQRNRR
ncbi:MAG: hypothetical protein A3G25_18670 [Betaproteobacteria bacterium RIFCSPLOWO2_12_FULL_63_13]|nr:MAG: hypothetical protein A3G25_18670 [Betaproteobacteria bacterium RIFCSPLOWO2_12_FULL_63_13]